MYRYIIAIVVALVCFVVIDYMDSHKKEPLPPTTKAAILFFLVLISVTIAHLIGSAADAGSGGSGGSAGSGGSGATDWLKSRAEINVGLAPF